MSASQQAANKRPHKIITRIEADLAKAQDRAQQAVDEANYYRRGFNSASKEIDAIGRVEDLQDRVRQLDAENSRLRHLIPEAWYAGQARMVGIANGFAQIHPDLREWMKQKGLT